MKKILYIFAFTLLCSISQLHAQADGFGDYNPNANKIEVVLYPNPLVGNDFKVKTNETPISILVMNTLGTVIYRDENIESNLEEQYEINLGNQRAGIYLVKVEFSNRKRMIKKLLIK